MLGRLLIVIVTLLLPGCTETWDEDSVEERVFTEEDIGKEALSEGFPLGRQDNSDSEPGN